MTEERRILLSRCGVGLCNRFGKWALWAGIDKSSECTPFAKDEIQNIMKDLGCDAVRAFMVVQDLTNTCHNISVNNIDDEWFWEILCKPIPEKKWYVKVPHAHKTYYHKWFDSDVLGAQSVQGVNDQLNQLDDDCKFTEAEIKKYHLEDCERVPIDD